MKLSTLIISFIVGVLVGAGALGGYWYWQHSTTEVWIAKRSMQSDRGILIPEGTELVLVRWMPEGFAALELGINAEGEALDHFQRRTEKKSFLRIPYFIDSSNK